MESLVVSLNRAKQLKAAGFPQESPIYWYEGAETGVTTIPPDGTQSAIGDHEEYSAPTAQELADQLPSAVSLECHSDSRLYTAWLYDLSSKELFLSSKISALPHTQGDTMAEALAALWLTLHEALPSADGQELAAGTDAPQSIRGSR